MAHFRMYSEPDPGGLRLPVLRTPAEPSRKSELCELKAGSQGLRLDIRYATSDNFMGRPVYAQARAFLQRPAAEALFRVGQGLAQHGLGLNVVDGYRPWAVTKVFWEATPPEQRAFVADPAVGSQHNRGCAVDLTLFDLGTGAELPMPSGFDEFSERSHATYAGGPAQPRANRVLLRKAMAEHGFTVHPHEWWHFDHQDWQHYPILDIPFEELDG